jgi:hypothetical protein
VEALQEGRRTRLTSSAAATIPTQGKSMALYAILFLQGSHYNFISDADFLS